MLKRKPEWLRIQSKSNPNIALVEELISNSNLNTVCAEANCPNYNECFSKKIATFMILGKNCTRNCNFCNVSHEIPEQISADEPKNLARAVSALGLKYVVITSVTRDDLADGGAEHFAKVIQAVRKNCHETAIEVLIPDFKGELKALRTVAGASPDVISHNVETVPELYAAVRQQAKYCRSLELLRNIKLINPKIHSKSGIMLGMGETKEQVLKLFEDLRKADCDFITIGQYLAPTAKHYPIYEFITPKQFEEYGSIAKKMGFSFVASAPLVRSSYNASEALAT
ncbi:MAG: lipoyl synthase [Oscillospiraceae bacterium]|nr:lipoyl synthase [Oscillospiraceae bacterium]MCL2279408.1 lipoyl synthase [Oscillospiraceae bacterium]